MKKQTNLEELRLEHTIPTGWDVKDFEGLNKLIGLFFGTNEWRIEETPDGKLDLIVGPRIP